MLTRGNKENNPNSNSAMKEVNQRVDQLETEFSKQLSKFKEEFLVCKISDGDDKVSRELLNKFQEFENNMMQEINKLRADMNKKFENLEDNIDYNMQKNNNKCLLIHGIQETDNERDVYNVVINLFQSKLQIPIEIADISDCYRLAKKSDKMDKRSRSIVVEFIHKYKRDEVFYKKKTLKGTKLLITELLTRGRLEIYGKCRSVYGQQCWTINGNIIVLKNGTKVMISNKYNLKKYLNID